MWFGDSVDKMHHEMFEAARTGRVVAFNAWARERDPRRELADQVEAEVKVRLQGMGYAVTETGHTAHYDLLACRDGRAMRVEVKAATWMSGRYSFQLRSNDADVLVMCCRNGQDHYFVIPFGEVEGLTYIKVSSYDPAQYVGKWIKFFEAWSLVDEVAATCKNPFQIRLL